jgi:hypothetical protein
MGEILSLFNKAEVEHEYRYLLINDFKSINAFNISSQVMKLSDNLYLHDLKVVRSYWENLAAKKNQTTISLIHREAVSTYGDDAIYIFSHHPFEAFLIFNALLSKESPGVYFMQNTMVKNLYANLSIDHWLKCCEELDSFFSLEGLLNSERKGSQSNYLKLSKMLSGLGIERVADLKAIHSVDLRRRFSAHIGNLHDWTFPSAENSEARNLDLFNYDRDIGLHGFPWVNIKRESSPQVKTDLDYPLSQWDHIKEELVKSFDKLLRFRQIISPNRLVLLKWSLTLFDLDQCQVYIRFKHPLCLIQDQKNDYEALTSQFHFAFNSLEQSLNDRYEDYDYFDVAHFCAWSIEVQETLSPSSINHELFSSLDEMVIDKDIEAFQNKIKGEMNRYSVLKVDIPDLDYVDLSESKGQCCPVVNGVIRPFFLFDKPVTISKSEIQEKRFLERTSSDWWARWDSQEYFRDYYMGSVDNQILYLFKNHLNQWYKHGVFS